MANHCLSNAAPCTRRDFMKSAALTVAGVAVGISASGAEATGKILNHNASMKYRRLGKTGLMVSCVCLGGHWKRLDTVIPGLFKTGGWLSMDLVTDPDFIKNRYDMVSKCMETGMNYIDACTGPEVMAYSKALKGRRDQMFLGYSWYEKEARNQEWRSTKKLLQGLDEGLKQADLDYVDLWRITCHEQGGDHTFTESEEIIAALDTAKKQGKARFTGVSSHNRRWLKMMIEQYPQQMEVVVTPYTSNTKKRPTDSLFEAVKRCDVGIFGIKPFAGTSLFKGDSSPTSAEAEADDLRARLAIRYILSNEAVTAPIPGLVNFHQVENIAKAVDEHKKLGDQGLEALHRINQDTWAKLPANYQWLKDWEYV